MTVFEIVDGEISGDSDTESRAGLAEQVTAIENFAKDIGSAAGIVNAERIAVVYADKGIGIRCPQNSESANSHGIELDGIQTSDSIVKKLL